MAERAIEPNDPTVPGSDPEHPTTGQVPIVSSVDGPRPPIPAEIWVLLVATFFIAIGFALIVPVLPQYALSFGVGATLVSVVVSAFAFMRLVFAPGAGALINRLGERRIYVAGLLIVAASTAAVAFAQDYWQLLVFRGLGGVGSVMFTISAAGMIARYSPPQIRGRISALWGGIFLIGNIAGPAVGGALAQFGIGVPFLVYSGTLVIAAAIVGIMMGRAHRITARKVAEEAGLHDAGDDRAPAARKLEPKGLREALQDSAYRASLVFGFANGWANFGVRTAILPLFVATSISQEPWVIGVVIAVGAVGNVLSLQYAGRKTDGVGRRPFILAGLAISAVAMFATAFAGDIVTMLVLSFVLGLGSGLAAPAEQAVISDIIGYGRSGGQVLSTYQMTQDGGSILGPIVAGVIADLFGFTWAIIVSSVMLAIACLSWVWGRETFRSA